MHTFKHSTIRKLRWSRVCVFATAFCLLLAAPAQAEDSAIPHAVLVIDASDSLTGKVSGAPAVVALGNALAGNFVTYDGTMELGIVSTGGEQWSTGC